MNLAQRLLAVEGPSARWRLADFESELQCSTSRSYLQADSTGSTTGFVLYRLFPDGIEIMNLAVAEKGRGLGRRLIAEFLDHLLKVGEAGAADEVRLEVSSENQPALRLYLAAGFQEYARRRAYYRDGSDAILMKRLLLPNKID